MSLPTGLPEELLGDIDGIVYVSDEAPYMSSDYYYGCQEMDALEIDEPGLLAELNKQKWEPSPSPGEIRKSRYHGGRWFYTFRWFCQDCRKNHDDYDEVMLTNELWKRLYPKDGFACPACMEKRLGRPLTPADCNNSPLSQMYWERRNG